MDQRFRNAGHSATNATIAYLLVKAVLISGYFAYRLSGLGEAVDYVRWGRRRFGTFVFYARRERLWRAMLDRLSHGELRVFEFGVAWGYCTAWWLRFSSSPKMQWDGFDRFVGLPRDWRNFQSGHFDAGGHPPESKTTASHGMWVM